MSPLNPSLRQSSYFESHPEPVVTVTYESYDSYKSYGSYEPYEFLAAPAPTPINAMAPSLRQSSYFKSHPELVVTATDNPLVKTIRTS